MGRVDRDGRHVTRRSYAEFQTAQVEYTASEESVADAVRNAGFDPEEWGIKSVAITAVAGRSQVRLTLLPQLIRPARAVPANWKPFDVTEKKMGEPFKRVLFLSDHHFPHHHKTLHQLMLHAISDLHPSGLVWGGDYYNLGALSRFETSREFSEPLQEAFDIGRIGQTEYLNAMDFHGRRDAGEDVFAWWLPGNHEYHLLRAIRKFLPQVEGLRRAGSKLSDWPVLSIPYLACVDELGITWIAGGSGANKPENWPNAEIPLTRQFFLHHGNTVASGAGAAIRKVMNRRRHSGCCGHTHTQAIVYETISEPGGKDYELVGGESGTMAERKDGLGYVWPPNWQQGGLCLDIYPRGKVIPSLLTYSAGALHGLGRRWT